MTSDHDQRVDATPRGQSQKQLSYSVAVVHRPGSPLKQEVVLSPDLPSSPRPHDDDDDDTPSHLRRSTRVYDQTQRWTVLTREAEADEVSLLSVTSEEKDYLNALVPDASPPLTRDGSPAGENARYSQVGSTLSGFEEGEFRGRDSSGRTTLGDEPRHQPEEKAFLDETIQFSEPAELPEFTPAEAPRTNSGHYVYYPIPIPKQLVLPPRLTGPHASKDIPPIATYRPPSVHSQKREKANDFLEAFLDTHETALQEDPNIILQPEFDSHTLLGTLMNNLRDTKVELKGRARTNVDYVPGGKSLIELDKDVITRIHMGKALSSRGGRNWGSGGGSSSSPRRDSRVEGESPRLPDDEAFESISLAEQDYGEVDEDIPLAMVQTRIVTQRADAEESLADRMKRLKEEKQKKEVKEGETLKERLARLKLEKNETLQERRQRLLEQRKSNAY